MSDIPTHMTAVQLLGHGGFEQLRVADDVPVPAPGPNEVLIRVAAAGINNTRYQHTYSLVLQERGHGNRVGRRRRFC